MRSSEPEAQETYMDKEYLVLVDENDRSTGGSASKREYIQPLNHFRHLVKTSGEVGILHRAFSVFLFDSQNRLLVQKRSSDKITFPHLWANTCCSHPLTNAPNETEPILGANFTKGVKRAAQRKLGHELGIAASQLPLDMFQVATKVHYWAKWNETWGENEVDTILICQGNVDMTLNPSEVSDVQYVTREQLSSLRECTCSGSSCTCQGQTISCFCQLTPWFARIIKANLLFKWWDSLHSITCDNEIHRL